MIAGCLVRARNIFTGVSNSIVFPIDLFFMLWPEYWILKELGDSNMRFHMLIPVTTLGPYTEELSHCLFDETRIRVKCSAKMGTIGIEGYMGLWIPPSDKDQDDAWEASRKAGEHDWWEFLKFVTVPSGAEFAPPEIIICFAPNTFFDRCRAIVKKIELQEIDEGEFICTNYEEPGDDLRDEAYVAIKRIFTKYLGAEVFDDGLWLDWK